MVQEGIEVVFIDSFEYDDYGTYLEYAFEKDGKQYYGCENVETFNFKSVIKKPVIGDYGKFMKRLFDDIKTTSNGMVFLDIEDMQDVESVFGRITLDDIRQFFKEYKSLNHNETLEIFFTESDFQEIKNGNFESVTDGCIGEVYGDFLCVFNEEVAEND